MSFLIIIAGQLELWIMLLLVAVKNNAILTACWPRKINVSASNVVIQNSHNEKTVVVLLFIPAADKKKERKNSELKWFEYNTYLHVLALVWPEEWILNSGIWKSIWKKRTKNHNKSYSVISNFFAVSCNPRT